MTFATELTIDEDFELEGIRTLGFHGNRFFKSMGYTASLNIGTYVIRQGGNKGALFTPGWQADGSFNLNTAGEFDFVAADVDSLTVLSTAIGVKLATQGIQFPARGMNTKNTHWMCSRVLPGIETS